jgi:hypothetical protein
VDLVDASAPATAGLQNAHAVVQEMFGPVAVVVCASNEAHPSIRWRP